MIGSSPLGIRTDIATSPADVVFSEEDGLIVARTASRPDFWFGNYAIAAPPENAASVAELAERTRTLVPQASRDVVMWETSAPHAFDLPEGFEYERRSVMVRKRRPESAGDGIVCVETDAGWNAVLELAISDAPSSPDFLRWFFTSMRGRCEAGDAAWWCIEGNGCAKSALGLFDIGDIARFAHIVTRAPFRGRGYASALMSHAMRVSAASTFVVVATLGSPAQRLYGKLGFTAASFQHVAMRPRR